MTVHRISHQPRHTDDWGSGDFAASRGGKFHKGRDYLYNPGERVRSVMEGVVLRIGWPYKDEEYRLIEILSHDAETKTKLIWRFFYVAPAVAVGETVFPAQVLGVAQDISSRYQREDRRPMGNHVHVECIVDPETFFDAVHNERGQLWT